MEKDFIFVESKGTQKKNNNNKEKEKRMNKP